MGLGTEYSKVVRDCALSVANGALRIQRAKGATPELKLTPSGQAALGYHLGDIPAELAGKASVTVSGGKFTISAGSKIISLDLATTFDDPKAVRVALLGLSPTTGDMPEWYRHERSLRPTEPLLISRIARERAEARRVADLLSGMLSRQHNFETTQIDQKALEYVKQHWGQVGTAVCLYISRCIELSALQQLESSITAAKTPQDLVIPKLISESAGLAGSSGPVNFGVDISEKEAAELFRAILGASASLEVKNITGPTDVGVFALRLFSGFVGVDRKISLLDSDIASAIGKRKLYETEDGQAISPSDLIDRAKRDPNFRWSPVAISDFLKNAGEPIPLSDTFSRLKAGLGDDIKTAIGWFVEALKLKLSAVREIGFRDLYKNYYRGGSEVLGAADNKRTLAEALVRHYGSVDGAADQIATRISEYQKKGVKYKETNAPAPVQNNNLGHIQEWTHYSACIDFLRKNRS